MLIILCGFGVVCQSFAKLLESRSEDLYARYGLKPRIVGVFDKNGGAVDVTGLDISKLINIKNNEINDCINLNKTLIDGLQIRIPTTQNIAKDIANKISNYIPIIISADYLSSTGNRWRTQLNENSKIIAITDNLPEMFHNSIEGYESKVFKQANPYFILLTSNLYPESVNKKFYQLKGLLKEHNLPYREINAVGKYKLSHLFSLLILGDYISYYLAVVNKIDPHYNPIITNSKSNV